MRLGTAWLVIAAVFACRDAEFVSAPEPNDSGHTGGVADTFTYTLDTVDTGQGADTAADTTESGFYTGPLLLETGTSGCWGGTKWLVAGETAGWTGGPSIFNAWETGNPNGWNEEHTLLSVAYSPDGFWDKLERSLHAGADYDPDVATLFICGVHDEDPVMTYAIRVFDLDDNYADCGIWTTDDSGGSIKDVKEHPQTGWDNPVTDSEQIASCQTLN